MWVLPDRSEGGSSLSSGEIELMIHRYILYGHSIRLLKHEFRKRNWRLFNQISKNVYFMMILSKF